MMPYDGVDGSSPDASTTRSPRAKPIDVPNRQDYLRIQERRRLLREIAALRSAADSGDTKAKRALPSREAMVRKLAQTGTDRVLILLVEFGGTNRFTWTPGVSTWDPYGECDNSEFDGTDYGNAAASAYFAAKYGISGPIAMTYTGPVHNLIERPRSADDESGTMIWTPDFSPAFYSNMVFGSGVSLIYNRQDGSGVTQDFSGRSVNLYYRDASHGQYSIVGEVLGWLRVTNSVWWYGADQIPGRRSGANSASHNGGISGAGSARQLVIDTIEAAKTAYPSFNWASYDQNGDGVIDRLWIIHAGLGEEDSPTLLDRSSYGEGGLWSHSWTLASPYTIVSGVSAYSYIMMPENSGIAVLAHEFAHNLGAIDLYAYGDGETSVGFWSLMSDDWVGTPIGFQPPGIDPMHLDDWGWLDPVIVSDPATVTNVTIGQTSLFPTNNPGAVRGVRIDLPDGETPLSVQPSGAYQWWGGEQLYTDAGLSLTNRIDIPAGGASLIFNTAYDTESGYDDFLVQVSTDGGGSWSDIASYSGTSSGFPSYRLLTNSLNAYANATINLRFWYHTDESYLGLGPFVDHVQIVSGVSTLFLDTADSGSSNWTLTSPWSLNNGSEPYARSYYLQWRNTSASGGYDSGLGDPLWRFGPATPGLLVWYFDGVYNDNEIASYMTHSPSFGPKGRMLVVDSHPEPYQDPYWLALGYSNEQACINSRSLMRDAAFGLSNTPDFSLKAPWTHTPTNFAGRAGVSLFSDALGYYPGLSWVGVPGSSSRWMTVQWDASVALPGASNYGTKAAGYSSSQTLWYVKAERSFAGTNVYVAYTTNVISSGATETGGTGDPGSSGVQFGWNVRVIEQSTTQGVVRIWNGDPLEFNGAGSSGSSLTFDWGGLGNRRVTMYGATNPAGPYTTVVAQVTNVTGCSVSPGAASAGYYRLGAE